MFTVLVLFAIEAHGFLFVGGDFEINVVLADVPISPVEPELHSRWL